MRTTIFDTPLIHHICYWISVIYLKISGWTVEGEAPAVKKYVMIAAPHTSNWDLPIMLFAAFVLRVKLFWMGKNTIFRWPFGSFFKWLGGIPIDRSGSHDMVAQSIACFRSSDSLVLVVPPEGTRKKVRYWKTGFYYIAHGAGVPIVLGFLDYKRKAAGMGPLLHTTGDLEADMKQIRAFYDQITGKYPDQYATADIAPKP